MNVLPLVLLALSLPTASVFAQVDYIARLATDESTAKRLGLQKLSDSERAEWNKVLSVVYRMGANSTGASPDAANANSPPKKIASAPIPTSGASVWLTKADLKGEDIIELRNGAVFEVAVGFVGVGISREVALIKEGTRWSLWVEGKREFRGRLLKAPQIGSAQSLVRTSILSVSSDGGIVKLLDGSVHEIDIVGRIHTMLWLPATEIFVIDGTSMINPDDSTGELVRSSRLK